MKQPYEDYTLQPVIKPGWGRLMIVLAFLAVLIAMFLLSGCAAKPPMVRTTTTSASPHLMGASAGAAATTVTEQPYESEAHKSFGKAAENLFAQ